MSMVAAGQPVTRDSESASAMGIMPLVDFIYGCRLEAFLLSMQIGGEGGSLGLGLVGGGKGRSGKKSKRPDLDVYNTA